MPMCHTALNFSEGLAFAQNWISIAAISSNEEHLPPDHVALLASARPICSSSIRSRSTSRRLGPRLAALSSLATRLLRRSAGSSRAPSSSSSPATASPHIYGHFPQFKPYVAPERIRDYATRFSEFTSKDAGDILMKLPADWNLDREVKMALIQFLAHRAQH